MPQPRRRMAAAARVCRPVLTNVWFRCATVLLAGGFSLWNLGRVPDASPWPAVLGLLPWIVGKYVLCPLRWHALSVSGRSRWWHIRAYAESELVGLLSPAHAGADLWRIHRLLRVGMDRGPAATEVGLDRLVGAVGLAVVAVLAGIALPGPVLAILLGVCAVALGVAAALRTWRPDLLRKRPLPGPGVLGYGLALSFAYQATTAGLLFGAVHAVGHDADPVRLIGVFGASQVAGIVPGVNGASPREGALAFGLNSLGLSWTGALAAVGLIAVLAWVPALLFGGASLVARRFVALRTA